MTVSQSEIKNIIICDDHPISQLGIEYGLKELFPSRGFNFFKVLTGKEALTLMKTNSFHLLILDLRLPDISGLEILKKMKIESIQPKVMVLTGEKNLPTLLQLLRYNVHAILLKSYSLDVMKAAFEHLENNIQDRIYLDLVLEEKLRIEGEAGQLTSREFEVLELIARGYTNKAVATLLNCSPETIKTHKTKIARKTNSYTTDDLSHWYYKDLPTGN